MKRLHPKIESIVNALCGYAPESIHLFGSWARGEADELSDIDLVIIKNTQLPFFERLAEAARLLPPDAGGVDLLIYTAKEFQTMLEEGNAFAEMIAEEGIQIYGRQSQN